MQSLYVNLPTREPYRKMPSHIVHGSGFVGAAQKMNLSLQIQLRMCLHSGRVSDPLITMATYSSTHGKEMSWMEEDRRWGNNILQTGNCESCRLPMERNKDQLWEMIVQRRLIHFPSITQQKHREKHNKNE